MLRRISILTIVVTFVVLPVAMMQTQQAYADDGDGGDGDSGDSDSGDGDSGDSDSDSDSGDGDSGSDGHGDSSGSGGQGSGQSSGVGKNSGEHERFSTEVGRKNRTKQNNQNFTNFLGRLLGLEQRKTQPENIENKPRRKTVSVQKLRSLGDVISTVKRQYDGRIIGVRLRFEGQKPIYRFKIVNRNGLVVNMRVNARTNQILSIRGF